jgi:hypothetical protein
LYDRIDIGGAPTPDGDTTLKFSVTPSTVVAQEMAITPDGSLLIFGVRARYHEANAPLKVLDAPCTANFDVAEYGVYTLDTRTGRSAYRMRSQNMAAPGSSPACVHCPTSIEDIDFGCDSQPGDRAAGISVIFGDSP